MGRKKSKKQKLYKMIGCSKKTRKNYLGGNADLPLAYTGQPIFSLPNPHLAYTGKGGASSCGITTPSSMPLNTNAANPTIPNTGPVSNGNNTIFNNASAQRGGCCGSCGSIMTGGNNHKGGNNHRNGCKCSSCKDMRGGSVLIPNGLVGSSWSANNGLPGVNGIPGDNNHYALNTYNNDVSRQMIDVGANSPYKGGKKRKQRGGALSNFLTQDLINLGRQFQFGVGTAYNALAGYSSPVNPLPWKDQLPSRASFNPRTI